jgi:hypothetical protein
MILNNIKIVEKDITDREDWNHLLQEGDGFFTKEEQVIWLENSNFDEITVQYKISVTGSSDFHPGDITEPPYTETNIKDIDIEITSVYINDLEYEISDFEKNSILSLLKEIQ